MTVVPNFLVKRIYQSGSLRNTNNGVCFDFKNILGPGHLNQVNEISVGEHSFGPEQVSLVRREEVIPATDISADSPYKVLINDVVSIQLSGLSLDAGDYDLAFDLLTHEAGPVKVKVKDSIR